MYVLTNNLNIIHKNLVFYHIIYLNVFFKMPMLRRHGKQLLLSAFCRWYHRKKAVVLSSK